MVSVQAIADRASTYDPVRAVLFLLALPFYAAGAAAAIVWLSATWLYAAAATGFVDARSRASGGVDG